MGGLLAAGQPTTLLVGCAWNFGWAGWAELCLGGLRLGSELLAGLGLRPADTPAGGAGWHTLRPVSDCAEGAWSAWAA